jgi:hypothetical protein
MMKEGASWGKRGKHVRTAQQHVFLTYSWHGGFLRNMLRAETDPPCPPLQNLPKPYHPPHIKDSNFLLVEYPYY